MSSSDRDWEKDFGHIVDGLEINVSEIIEEETIASEPDDSAISDWEIHRALVGMTEASTYLGRFFLQRVVDEEHEFDPAAIPFVREIIKLTETISTILADCDCPECVCQECTDEEMCQDCIDDLEDETDDDF